MTFVLSYSAFCLVSCTRGRASHYLDNLRELFRFPPANLYGLEVFLELLRRRDVGVDEAVEVYLTQHRPALVRLLFTFQCEHEQSSCYNT